jgi:capsular polysaccharide transport system ATP-binding protein
MRRLRKQNEELESARAHLAREELFEMQCVLARQRARQTAGQASVIPRQSALLSQFLKTLSFDLTGAQNTRFVARVYGVDTDELLDFVEDFASLGAHFHMPVRSYSSGMRSRLAFGISMGIRFGIYLIDEVTSVGDAAFRRKSAAILRARMEHSGAIIVTHSFAEVRNLCDIGAVLEEGKLYMYDRVGDAIAHHVRNMELAG